MRSLLNRFKRVLIVLSFPYLYVLFVLVVPTEQAVTAPGGLTPVENSINLETVQFVENFHTVYVYSFYPITAFQSFILENDPEMSLYPITIRQRDTSWRDDYLSGQIAKFVSLKSSVIKAYELASEEDSTIDITYLYKGLYLTYRPSRLKELSIGDEIIAINGIGYDGYAHEDFLRLAYLDDVTFTIRRTENDDEVVFDYRYLFDPQDAYMLFYPNYEIIEATPSFTLPGMESVIGGPSGGMIQTLSIYASLLNINFGDLNIVGTGTIEMSGNVGRIGGIQQKLYTAKRQKADLFFMPESHLDEINNENYGFEIIAVETIEEAVNALYERAIG